MHEERTVTMAEMNEQQLPTSERLKEVALLLKQADRLVKEGNLSDALELIVKARSFDSRHLYALAYEERVRTLLNAKLKEEQRPNHEQLSAERPPEASDEKIGPALHHLSNLAIIEAQHSATVAAQQEQAQQFQKKESEEKAKHEEMRRNAIEAKIDAFLHRAANYLERKEYNRALDEIARAYLLDPVNDKIHGLEDRIHHTIEESRRRDEEEKLKRLDEERSRREQQLKSNTLLLQKEKEEKLRREEEERKFAQQEKVRQYLQHVTELFEANKLDEALGELAFVIVIDPLNEEVLKIEHRILEAQERRQQEQLELYQRQLEERQKRREAIQATIRKHIGNAQILAKQQKFTEALRTVTRATVLDPLNDELQQCESEILAMQEEFLRREEEQKKELQEQIRRQQEEELKRLEHEDRERVVQGETEQNLQKRRADKEKIAKYLERAKKFLAEKQFEVSLGEVALAFIVNPFDEDIKKIEQEILAAREQFQQENTNALQRAIQEEIEHKSNLDRKIDGHLREADRLRSLHQYSKAFNEVAQAFILDPLSSVVQHYEQSLQIEFDAFLSSQHRKKENENKSSIIQSHRDRAMELLAREQFEEALSEIAAGLSHEEHHQELLALQDRIIRASQAWQQQQSEEYRKIEIQKILVNAHELLTVGKAEDAKRVIEHALELDPQKPESLALLADIETVLAQFQHHRLSEERERRVRNHLNAAQSYLMANLLDKAMVEILAGLVLDPAHEELLKLEHRVNTLHDAHVSSVKKRYDAARNNPVISAEEKHRLTKIHQRVALEFLAQKEFSKALDEIALGLTVDPFDTELLKIDGDIRREQADHDQKVSQGLKLIYSSGKSTG